MFKAYKKFWLQYADFTGKSTRSDYWWVVLCNFLIALPFGLIASAIFMSQIFSILASYADSYYTMTEEELAYLILSNLGALLPLMLIGVIWNIAIFVPTLALQVRRLRDAGFHWAFIFFNLGQLLLPIPFIGWLFALGCQVTLIVFFCFPSKNQAGSISAGYAAAPQTPTAAPDGSVKAAETSAAVHEAPSALSHTVADSADSAAHHSEPVSPAMDSAVTPNSETESFDSAISEKGE
ncbi:DUF805 domain-containing protein [Streptococcus pantholopis]|uniref:DUF805 domain-containing protein n=1 Tax=Streptococcus pantholopis TaxID=1811193 RepID=A0A172Q8C2_9STRE|nr:DUF805 domain-containing protein [Streptococcus pantholopis]AND79700.1 hypothetical protein A0O21_06510 [Streptococcus pantholopis]